MRGSVHVRAIARPQAIACLAVACVGAAMAVTPSTALAAPPAPRLAALAPAEDARQAVPIGPMGEVYEPDGTGAWVRRARVTTAGTVTAAGRAGGAVVAFADGVIYRHAPNGWTALRLAQKGKAVMSSGPGTVAAVRRQLYALDKLADGEPAKLAHTPSTVLAIGSGKQLVLQLDQGLFRLQGGRLAPIKNAPRELAVLVSDRWVIRESGAVDLRTGRVTAWPAGFDVEIGAHAPDDRLIAVGHDRTGLALISIRGTKVEHARVELDRTTTGDDPAMPVGVVMDRSGRVVIALRDGRIVLRERGAWTTTRVRDELPAAKPGSPPATSR